MTSGQHIDYDALALEALRGVVKACLAQVARTGLVGEHHFYIAFNTQALGVGMSKRLKEKYPVEMTIVLQHRFWDLIVDQDRFEVKLTFDGIPERLVVPFSAVKVFYDPSVPYVLQFEEVDPATGTGTGVQRRSPRRVGGPNGPVSVRENDFAGETAAESGTEKPDRRRPTRKPRGDPMPDAASRPEKAKPSFVTSDDQAERMEPIAPPAATPAHPNDGKPVVVAVSKSNGEGKDSAQSDDEAASPDESGGAKIFDLSKFRSKK